MMFTRVAIVAMAGLAIAMPATTSHGLSTKAIADGISDANHDIRGDKNSTIVCHSYAARIRR